VRTLAAVARWETIALVASFGIITLWKLFQSVSFDRLLQSSDGTISPGRVQMLVLTVLTALQYLLTTVHDPTHLPRIPEGLVIAMGGSQAIYLGAKAWSIFGK